jgi:glutamine synthetase
VALKALAEATDLVKKVEDVGLSGKVNPAKEYCQRLYDHSSKLSELLDTLDSTHAKLDSMSEVLHEAKATRDELLPLLVKIRVEIDALELIVNDNDWPLPKYGEMLWQ